MKEMGKVARKYKTKTGPDNSEVAELCLDVVQGMMRSQVYIDVPFFLFV